MITGTIDLRDKKLSSIMIDFKKVRISNKTFLYATKVFYVNSKDKFNRELIERIVYKSYSRIPVLDSRNPLNVLGKLFI